jgi:hypothetical protein
VILQFLENQMNTDQFQESISLTYLNFRVNVAPKVDSKNLIFKGVETGVKGWRII